MRRIQHGHSKIVVTVPCPLIRRTALRLGRFAASTKDMEEGIAGLGDALRILREYYAKEPALLQQPDVTESACR